MADAPPTTSGPARRWVAAAAASRASVAAPNGLAPTVDPWSDQSRHGRARRGRRSCSVGRFRALAARVHGGCDPAGDRRSGPVWPPGPACWPCLLALRSARGRRDRALRPRAATARCDRRPGADLPPDAARLVQRAAGSGRRPSPGSAELDDPVLDLAPWRRHRDEVAGRSTDQRPPDRRYVRDPTGRRIRL